MVEIATDPNASLELRGRMNAELAQYVYPKREAVSENEGTLHAVHPRGNVLNPDRESRRGRSRFRDEAIPTQSACDAPNDFDEVPERSEAS